MNYLGKFESRLTRAVKYHEDVWHVPFAFSFTVSYLDPGFPVCEARNTVGTIVGLGVIFLQAKKTTEKISYLL